ncbi:hypothetical protein, partial [Klebsiella pneumoniae]|uniref:hypothetical protein n=1 Tax=Klebsiella pneumoniae TaxID=573 RepID=UPI0025A30CA0
AERALGLLGPSPAQAPPAPPVRVGRYVPFPDATPGDPRAALDAALEALGRAGVAVPRGSSVRVRLVVRPPGAGAAPPRLRCSWLPADAAL